MSELARENGRGLRLSAMYVISESGKNSRCSRKNPMKLWPSACGHACRPERECDPDDDEYDDVVERSLRRRGCRVPLHHVEAVPAGDARRPSSEPPFESQTQANVRRNRVR